ncbi:MAG: orotidine-5'-phosphate decarboxylase, partial [Firmicutes bacterium]|nr:orotidine-5'-phosphate decarboxylase [Bacillota bacterium]
PTTVARAVRAARRSGASLLTVHAGGGRAMLRAAVEAAREPGHGPAVGLLGVTVLTSLDQEDLAEVGVAGTLEDHVLRLAGLAASEGLDGVVASVAEAGAVRAAHGPRLLIVTPGVRPAWAREPGDQARVATPREAVLAGADLVVVGRPLTGAADPVVAAEQLGEELTDALSLREPRPAGEKPWEGRPRRT